MLVGKRVSIHITCKWGYTAISDCHLNDQLLVCLVRNDMVCQENDCVLQLTYILVRASISWRDWLKVMLGRERHWLTCYSLAVDG